MKINNNENSTLLKTFIETKKNLQANLTTCVRIKKLLPNKIKRIESTKVSDAAALASFTSEFWFTKLGTECDLELLLEFKCSWRRADYLVDRVHLLIIRRGFE